MTGESKALGCPAVSVTYIPGITSYILSLIIHIMYDKGWYHILLVVGKFSLLFVEINIKVQVVVKRLEKS